MGFKINHVAQKLKIAFLTSIYPAHAEKIYRDNPSLKDKSSDEQMEFIRWHALSSYVRWVELLESHQCKVIQFHHNLDNVESSWAKENNFSPVSKNKIIEIGLEKIKRFEPDILYCSAPFIYTRNSFIQNLLKILKKRPKLIAWYGANCGNEEIFNLFDLTLSNSNYLVSRIRQNGGKADVLQHSFDPIILQKIGKCPFKKNRIAFFGNLDSSSEDFRERTKFLHQIAKKSPKFDIFGEVHRPNFSERVKFYLLQKRSYLAKTCSYIISSPKLEYWSDMDNLPPSPWPLPKDFTNSVHSSLYGQEMLTKLNSYQISFNFHNKHTVNHACNMRIFEATGLGNCLLTDHKTDIQSIFEPDREIITYKSVDEAISKSNYLLENPKVAAEIGLAGQRKTLANYSSEKQIEVLHSFFRNSLN